LYEEKTSVKEAVTDVLEFKSTLFAAQDGLYYKLPENEAYHYLEITHTAPLVVVQFYFIKKRTLTLFNI
jgi:hypothetical protein